MGRILDGPDLWRKPEHGRVDVYRIQRGQLRQLLRRGERPESSHGRDYSDKAQASQPRAVSTASVWERVEMPTTITDTPADVVLLGVGYISGAIAAEL